MNHCRNPLSIAPVIHYVNVVEPAPAMTRLWPRRRFVDFQLQLMLQGEMRYELPESREEFIARPGEVVFIRPGELNTQELRSDSGASHFACVHFLLADTVEVRTDPEPARINDGLDVTLFGGLFVRLFEAFSTPGQYTGAIASGIVRELYLRLLTPDNTSVDGMAARVRTMTRYLDEHLLSHPGRADLVRHFHLAPEYINQLFRRYLGLSPGEYVHQQLAREGYRLLSRENLRVKECAEKLGFQNQFHFCRIFRREYAMPPSKLRNRLSS